MRTLLNAVLNFGLVYVPVGVASSVQSKDVKFKLLHDKCSKPISQSFGCEGCDMSHLGTDQIVKGFEFAKGQFVTVTQDELEAFEAQRNLLITLTKFVQTEELDLLGPLVDKMYVLSPNEKLHKPYELLSRALQHGGWVAMGKATLWKKEHPIAVVPSHKGVLYLKILHTLDELVSDASISEFLSFEVSDEELELADKIITMQAGHVDHDDLMIESRRQLGEFIDSKIKGTAMLVPSAEETPEATVDLMAALRASLGEVELAGTH